MKMGLKVLLNIFYTISIILLVLSIVWSFNHKRYDLLVTAFFLVTMFIILKIRLAKQVREMLKKP